LYSVESVAARFHSKELSSDTWQDFARLFEKHGGVWGGCWCMFHHTTQGWSRRSARQNREEKELLVRSGKSHGVLVFDEDEQPFGWSQFGLREELPRVERKRGYKDAGEDSLWRVTCFFIDKEHRKKGVAREALRAALEVMEREGAKTVEAYPPAMTREGYSSSFLWAGTKHLLSQFGFKQTRKLGKTLVMSKRIHPS
jgi:GNAT superfamily N-acetyltransferase